MTISKADILQLGSKALSHQNYKVAKVQVEAEIEQMANAIFRSPTRNGRSLDTIRLHCKRGIVTETAAVMIFGGYRNTQQFDYTNPDTYFWDACLTEKKLLSEIKWIEDDCEWVTYYNDNIKTFNKFYNDLDVFLAAKMNDDPQELYYEVSFVLVANAKTFFDYWKPSSYNSKHYYNHFRATANGQCYPINLKE
jgi:hypothetical protein